MKKCAFMLLVLFLIVAFITGTAAALTLGAVDGSWSNTIGGSGVHNIDGVYVDYGNHSEDQVRWGTSTGEGQSGLGFTGAAPPPFTFGLGEAFEIGQLRHFNNPIAGGTAATSTDLAIQLVFTDPFGLTGSFNFSFAVNETPNTNIPPDDFIYFPAAYPTETFDIGGIDYTLQLLGFGDSADDLVSQFQSPEGGTNATLLWGRITTPGAPIPEPATLLLLGSGLAGLAGLRRKFKKA